MDKAKQLVNAGAAMGLIKFPEPGSSLSLEEMNRIKKSESNARQRSKNKMTK